VVQLLSAHVFGHAEPADARHEHVAFGPQSLSS
jgi:hypothetical protein